MSDWGLNRDLEILYQDLDLYKNELNRDLEILNRDCDVSIFIYACKYYRASTR